MRKKYVSLLLIIILFCTTVLPAGGITVAAQNNSELPLTGFEKRDSQDWTTLEEEIAFLQEVAAMSERVRFSQFGTSVEGRPIYLVRVGYPVAPTDEAIAAGRNIFILGTPHGNEPAGREMALKLLRDLAFTNDPDMLEMLGKSTILFMPTPNPDGRQANIRYNAWGIDNNRDYLNLLTPESQTVAKVLSQFKPDITVDAHERPSGSNPDMQMLWPRNLNVDKELYELNVEMIQEYLRPEVEKDGFSTGLYGTPGGAGGEDERILRNNNGLRHSISLLTESAGRATLKDRVDMQVSTVEAVFRFYNERFDEIVATVSGAAERKRTQGAAAIEPYYFDGADDYPSSEEGIMNPPVCGYLLNTQQVKQIERHIELYSIETEQASEHGVFVTMAQPMMTVIPLLLDERATYNEVNGLPLYDCTNLGSIEPPELPQQTEPMQYETYFSEDTVNEQPAEWSSLWRNGSWKVLDGPRRLSHDVNTSGRRALTWDKVGDAGTVHGDVEISGLVRVKNTGETLFQLGLHMSGDAGAENSYYIDLRSPTASTHANHLRIGIYKDGTYTRLGSTKVDFTASEDTWYQVLLKRENNKLMAKIWPYGEDEPDHYQVVVSNSSFNSGKVGMSHLTRNSINDWAYISVGTGGEESLRPAQDLPGIVSIQELQNSVDAILNENLKETNYTTATWEALQDALTNAQAILQNPLAVQSEVNNALATLKQARAELEHKHAAQYHTDFKEYAVGTLPNEWSMLWKNSNWIINDNPYRLTHTVDDNGNRQALIWDKIGEIDGDVEISGVVRANNSGDTLFQIGFHMSGEEGKENAYYLDLRKPDANGSANRFRINKYVDGKYTLLKSIPAPFTVSQDTWYQVVFKREGHQMQAKVWPFGEEEPDFELEFTDYSLNNGFVGVAATTPGTINDWAFIGVGTGGMEAPRAPDNLFEPSEPEVDKSTLQAKVDEIKRNITDGILAEDDYTLESWRELQGKLDAAQAILEKEDATQEDVDAAKSALEEALRELVPISPTVDKSALQAKVDDIMKDIVDGTLEEEDYTPGSWQVLQEALTAAQEVLDNDEATKEQVNKALADLDNARNALKRKDSQKAGPLLENLEIPGVSLSPSFSPEVTKYTATVTNDVYQVTIKATVTDDVYVAYDPSNPVNLVVGDNPITIKVFEPTDPDQYTDYTVKITRQSRSSSGGGGGGGGSITPSPSPQPPKEEPKQEEQSAGVVTTVNGKEHPFAIGTTTDGVTMIQIDSEQLKTILESGRGQQLGIAIDGDGEVQIHGLTAEDIRQLKETGSTLEISTPLAIYPIPNQFLDLDALSKQFGNVALDEIKATITIQASGQAYVEQVQKGSYELLVNPVQFDLSFTYEGKTAQLDRLNGYAPKYLALPAGIDPQRIITGISIYPNGTVFHVPTIVVTRNGQYYAEIKDLFSRGHYAVIWNPKQFTDVENHWSQADANEMGSRLVIEGTGNNLFSPNREITRAEFATFIARGLGLMHQHASQNSFTDVSRGSWYHDPVLIANEFKIVLGYEDGSFHGNQQITREQGIAMIARAYRLIEAQNELSSTGVEDVLAKFTDGNEVSSWAQAELALMVSKGIVKGDSKQQLHPQEQMTRAEAVALIRRVLLETGLIN